MTGQEKVAFLENVKLGPMVLVDMRGVAICLAGCSPKNHDPRTCVGDDTMDSCPQQISGEVQTSPIPLASGQYSK